MASSSLFSELKRRNVFRVGLAYLVASWLVLKMLGEEEEALKVLRQFEFDDVPFILSAWLSYPSFDPTPFPALMAILERENVDRAPTMALPYACSQPDSFYSKRE